MSQMDGPMLSSESSEDPRVLDAVREYLDAIDAGHPLDRREFLNRHADIALQLEEWLGGFDFVTAATSMPATPPLIDDTPGLMQLGDYKLIRELGRGGMGIVYEALQVSLGRGVAVKVLPFAAAMDSRRLQRFHNEAQMAAQLHHTNIVPVYGVGCEQNVHFYAMQLIEGESLADIIRGLRGPGEDDEKSDQPPHRSATRMADSFITRLLSYHAMNRQEYYRAVAKLGVQVAEALEHAHRVGIIHRDVKPANLILDDRGTVWITDFGLAQLFTDVGLTQPGDLPGTLCYMSPEQASGRAAVLDQRTDIYSLGLTLYEMLTLRRAVTGKTRQEVLRQIEEQETPAARLIDEQIPRELSIIVAKAIAREPGERYQSAKALAEDLERYLRDEPIHARPPTVWEKAAKWAKRHRAASTSIFAVMVGITICSLTAVTFIAREQYKTTAAFEQELTQRYRADMNAARARDAVDYFAGTAAEEFPRQPHFVEIKRRMLQRAEQYYADMAADNADSPRLQAQLEASRLEMADNLAWLDVVSEAIQLDHAGRLLRDPAVQDDLNLSPAQRARIDRVAALTALPPRPSIEDETEDPIATQMQARKDLARRRDVAQVALAGLLTPEQSTRLAQISRQTRGVAALMDPDVVRALQLDDDQRSEIFYINRQLTEREVQWTETERQWQMRRAMDRAVKILDPDQQTTWQHLIGRRFRWW